MEKKKQSFWHYLITGKKAADLMNHTRRVEVKREIEKKTTQARFEAFCSIQKMATRMELARRRGEIPFYGTKSIIKRGGGIKASPH